MPKCRICQTNEANQTGAHILPAWMISSAFNEGSNTRDHEIIWKIRVLNSPKPYFGREVKPEKIVETIGRDLSEDEIRNQINPITVDNMWCRDCEKRFSTIEEYFLNHIDRKTEDFNQCNDLCIITLENANVYLIRLFLYTLIIRADLSGFAGFRLYPKAQKRLVRFLNKYLHSDLDETIKNIEHSDKKSQLLSYPYRLIKTEQAEVETSNLLYIHDRYEKPYCFMINRYILQFYGKGNHSLHRLSSFYGISGIISNAGNFRNYKEKDLKICLMNLRLWKEVLLSIVEVQASIEFKQILSMVDNSFRKTQGHKPSRNQVNGILNVLFDLR